MANRSDAAHMPLTAVIVGITHWHAPRYAHILVDRLGTLALDVIATDPERSTMLLRNETELWSKVVKSPGAKAE